MLESLQALDTVRLNFSTQSQHIINITLAFIMFGVALGIKVDDFRKIAYNPKTTVIGVISQFLLLPAITFLVIWCIRSRITPSVAFGMILVASCPGGNISNFITSLSKGNPALSVSLTAIATLSAIFLTPANFAFWGGLFAESSHLLRPIEIPIFQVFQTVFILLGIPLIAGLLFSWRFPKITKKIIKPIQLLSVIIFMGFVVGAFTANFSHFIRHVKYIFLIVMVHNAIALFTGYSFSSLFRVPRIDRRTITIETGIQNSGLGLALIFNPKIFPVELEIGGMAFIAAWWGIWHILSGLGISFFWSKIPILEKKTVRVK